MADVLLVDDHPLMQLGLERRLTDLGLTVCIGDITSRNRLLDQATDVDPTAVILDYGLPSLGDGLGLIEPLNELGLRVLILTGTVDDVLWGALLSAGAEAVVSKAEPLDDITDAILAVVAGQPIRVQTRAALLELVQRDRESQRRAMEPFESLSTRESIVLGYLISGVLPAAIAEAEFVSVDTVRSQIKSVLRKLDVSSQLEAVALANRVAWQPPLTPGG